MSTNSIFILKPIWDALYEDAKKDREEMDSFKKRLSECDEEHVKQLKKEIEMLTLKISELESENTALKSRSFSYTINDAAYENEANAPISTYIKENSKNEIVIPIIIQKDEVQKEEVEKEKLQEESTKTVKMVGSKTKQEYQKEYQRNYRKKQKNITMNL